MRLQGVVLAGAMLIGSASGLWAAENTSADGFSHDAQIAFRAGEYKKAAKLFQNAVKLDPANADYREGLGRAYERQAEAASFPLLLTNKARNSYLRALELQPDNAAAIADLIELNQQPVGLCEGSLTEASLLIDRLNLVDIDSAKHAREDLADAQLNAARPGQRFLCGPVKLSRVITDHVLPHQALQLAAAPETDTVVALAGTN